MMHQEGIYRKFVQLKELGRARNYKSAIAWKPKQLNYNIEKLDCI